MQRSLPTRILINLLIIETVLVLMYWADLLAGQPSWTISALIDLNGEGTIPAWFSSMQLAFLSATLFALHYLLAANDQKRYHGVFLLAAVALFFSVDEMLSIHERLNELLIGIAWFPRFKYNNGSWLPVYFVALVIVTALCAVDFNALRRCYRRSVLAMGAGVVVAIFGAVLLEIVSYQYLFADQGGVWYLLEVGVEELCEMAGVSLLLFGAMTMLAGELERSG